MGLASGTLADVRHDSDYLKILKMHATIEPLLNQLIEKSITTAMAHPKVNFPAGHAVAELTVDSRLERKLSRRLMPNSSKNTTPHLFEPSRRFVILMRTASTIWRSPFLRSRSR
jgi:hypothetical protein